MPGPRSASQDPAADGPAALAGVIVLLGVSFVVMAFAMFHRRPPVPKPAPLEMRDFTASGSGRINKRLLLIVLGMVILWLAVFAAVSRVRFESEYTAPAPPTTTAVPDDPAQPATEPRPEKPRSEAYRLLVGATGVLLVMVVASTVVAAVRNRSTLPPVAVTAGPEVSGSRPAEPLVMAAERGLVQVANLALDPREAIIACYAVMEQALAAAPGAAPQASDTPSEVLARAVRNRTIGPGSAATLVGLFAEARFSRHTMTEGHRDEAEGALRSVLGELRSKL